VAVKARVVKLNPQRGAARGRQFVSAKAVEAHLRYLERDGVTKDGAKGQVYSAERDVEDGRAFLERAATIAISSASSSRPRMVRSYPICAPPRAT
jgi:type IV secretory pathway VirD2 relaxase